MKRIEAELQRWRLETSNMSNMKDGGRWNEAHEREKGGNEDKGQKEAGKWKSQLDTDTACE